MAGNSIGTIFKLTTFGESHGVAIGGIIDGCPPNILLDVEKIQFELARRRPGQSEITTARNEKDEVKFLSGIFEGKTTGTPIGFIIENSDQKSQDYDTLKEVFRPSHADYTYQNKYGLRDHRGGGRSSARETAARVVAGAIAKQILAKLSIQVKAFVSQIGTIRIENLRSDFSLNQIEESLVRCPDEKISSQMINLINSTKQKGDSLGGEIHCKIQGVPVGLGEPVFDKLNADLGKAMLSINAVKGFEIGSGFSSIEMLGSEHNDSILPDGKTATNNSGGILGGISNGEEIYFNVAFKPVATISQKQKSIDTNNQEITLEAAGRHDPCVVPRAVPIVEAMAAITILDHYLRNQLYLHWK